MKITMEQLLDSVPSLNKIITENLPLKTAHKLSLLMDKLDPHLKFFNQQRANLPEGEAGERKMRELLDLDIEVDAAPVDIPLDTDMALSAWDIRNLAPFVHFAEPDKEASNG